MYTDTCVPSSYTEDSKAEKEATLAMPLGASERQAGLGSVKCEADGEPGTESPTPKVEIPRGKDACSPKPGVQHPALSRPPLDGG